MKPIQNLTERFGLVFFIILSMRYLLAFIRLLLLFIISLTYLIIGLIIWNVSARNRNIARYVVQSWGRIALLILNVQVEVTGCKPDQNGILMPNHRGYLDVFIVLAYYPSTIVAKKELMRWPVIGHASALAGIIPVDRGSSGSLIQTMRRIEKEVRGGETVVLFPEGTTFIGPLTKPFKPGSFKIAFDTQTPVIPAAICYADENDAWVGDDLFIPHFFRQMGKWRTRAWFWFGEPITCSSFELLMNTTKEVIDTKLKEFKGIH
jgi:1-acyl-sn-glycerol-3-phosphate acyltransferase